MDFIDTVIGKLAPHVCVGCGQEGTLLCPACTAMLPASPFGDLATISGVSISDEGLLLAATSYDGMAKELVWRLKFSGARAAAKTMARRMVPLVTNLTKGGDVPESSISETILVPVPTAASRARQRGFDQAKLLVRYLSKYTGLRSMDCLWRYGRTHQVGASREQRLAQIDTALRPKASLASRGLQACRVILVDDVVTTGATLQVAANALRPFEPRRIDAIVFAGTV